LHRLLLNEDKLQTCIRQSAGALMALIDVIFAISLPGIRR